MCDIYYFTTEGKYNVEPNLKKINKTKARIGFKKSYPVELDRYNVLGYAIRRD